jgi:phage-related baseplate assembly protein
MREIVILNVAASAVAVARSRVAGAARAVAVTRAVDFALDDDAVAVVAVMSVDEECEDAGDEEEDDVPGSLLVTYYYNLLKWESYMMPNAHDALSIAH